MSSGGMGGAADPLDVLLDRLLDAPPGGREALLNACGDPALARRARALLALEGSTFLEGGIGAMAPGLLGDLEPQADPYPPGSTVGGYRVVRKVGQGGMGAVYLAQRQEGDFTRQVALKFVRGGPGSEELSRRFLLERRIQAALAHPHIARLYDAGVSARGDPYFVMEYVEGQPINGYCAERRLSVEARLLLFDQVCDATDYAHRQLVVHRDLKPANVMVTSGGEVKLLDFGVAKLLREEDGSPETTRTAVPILTPEYASPEQILGSPVSTSNDIYSLGVLLYELLVGRRPHLFPDRSPLEVARVLQDRLPPAPSAAAGGPDPDRGSDGEGNAAEGVERMRLSRRLSGDLDAILLKALRPEPQARYPSVAALRDDLRRHREGRRVLARPGTAGYRAGLFLRRNRMAVGGGVLLALALASGMAATLWQAGYARRQAIQSERITELLVSLFTASDPDVALGRERTARELLEEGTLRVRVGLVDEPGVQSELLAILAKLHTSLGEYARADSLAAVAVGLRRAEGRSGRAGLAESLSIRTGALLELAAFDSAESFAREALALEEAMHPQGTASRTVALANLASVLSRSGRSQQAEPLYRAALAASEAAGDTLAMAQDLSNLGVLLQRDSRYEESLPLLEQALELQRSFRGGRHTGVNTAQLNLAETLRVLGDFPRADSLLAEVVTRRTELLGPDHPDVAMALNNRGEVLREAGRLDESLEVHLLALAIRRASLRADHPMVAASLNNVAVVKYFQLELEAAAQGFLEARDLFTAAHGPAHAHTISAINNLASVRRQQGRLDEAETAFRDLLSRITGEGGTGQGSFGWTTAVHNLGWTLFQQGRLAEARENFRVAADHFRRLQGSHPNTGTALGGLGRAELELGHPEEADVALVEAVAILAATLEHGSLRTADYQVWRGVALLELGRTDEARTLLEAGLEPIRAARGPEDPVRQRGEEALQRIR